MYIHDPREFVRGLQQILVSDSKRIGFLTGAGTSMVKEKPLPEGSLQPLIPGTAEMTKIVTQAQKGKQLAAVRLIESELLSENEEYHIENLISKITQKESVVGTEILCGLNKIELEQLRRCIEKEIFALVSIHNEKGFSSWQLTHYKFAQWIHDATRKNCVEIFTTNYDYLFEIAFERYSIPYFDGFIGSYVPFFHSASLEDDTLLRGWTKLWKLHGSLGWGYDKEQKKIIRGDKSSDTIMIFPSILKYDNSRKQPYASYLDRLSRFTRGDDTVLFICGYSFGDQHINDTILNALSKAKTSNAIAFYFGDFEENSIVAKLAKEERRLSIYGTRHAVIGGRYGQWRLKNLPTEEDEIQIGCYFDQDAAEPTTERGVEHTEVNMTGSFKLSDFSCLVSFLADLNYSNYKLSPRK